MHHPILLSFLIMYLLKIDIEPLFFWGGFGGPQGKTTVEQDTSRSSLSWRALGVPRSFGDHVSVGGVVWSYVFLLFFYFSNMGVSKNRGTPPQNGWFK